MATSAPAPVATTTTQSQTVSNVSELTFAQKDPAGYKEYVAYRTQAKDDLYKKYYAEEVSNFGPNASTVAPMKDAVRDASLAANQQFAQQISAAGAGTITQSTTPLLATQPTPPTATASPVAASPYADPAGTTDGPLIAAAGAAPSPTPATNTAPTANKDIVSTVPQQSADQTAATKQLALSSAQIQAQRKQANDGDWRVKIRLAGGSQYLYNNPDGPGILQPLAVTGGVIFPYTPTINTSYKANYNAYDLTHSNYKGYFYQNSSVGDIKITGSFTAQDTNEANYLLAVIHFFRSVTKMFYGQDTNYRGAPPPLVFLQGLGTYQFNLHPCVVTSFDYNLPGDVDYIRAGSVSNQGTNLSNRRDKQNLPTNSTGTSRTRLANNNLTKGAINEVPSAPTLTIDSPTYVPTKMEISVTLLPVQTRTQVSKQFSLSNFANGNLQKGGFW